MKIPEEYIQYLVGAAVGAFFPVCGWIIKMIIPEFYRFKVNIWEPIIYIKRENRIKDGKICEVNCLLRIHIYNGKNKTYEYPLFTTGKDGYNLDLINLERHKTFVCDCVCNIDDFEDEMKTIKEVYFKYKVGADCKFKQKKLKSAIIPNNS